MGSFKVQIQRHNHVTKFRLYLLEKIYHLYIILSAFQEINNWLVKREL